MVFIYVKSVEDSQISWKWVWAV